MVDPALTDTMGPRLTMATGLDAMSHAMESIWVRTHTRASDDLVARALDLVRLHLHDAIERSSTTARNGMMTAALLAGVALARCRSGAAHALSYALTGCCGIEHGLAVGLLCRALLPVIQRRDPDRVGLMLDSLHVHTVDDAAAFVERAVRLAGVEPSLAALGVSAEMLPWLAEQGLAAQRFANQPGDWTRDQVVTVLRAAF